jgi:ACS family hexuronate transporter-like MFS transporter
MSNLHRVLLLLLLITSGVLNYADRQIIAILKLLMQGDLGWSDSDYGRLTSVFQLAAAISLLGAGWFVDKVGVRLANPLGVAAWSLAAIAHAFVRSLGAFTVVRVALGATEAVNTPAIIKSVAVWFRDRERPLVLGAMNAAGSLGAIVTPLAVAPLAQSVGWQGAFVIVGGLGFIWVACWLALITRPGFPRTDHPATAQPATGNVSWRVALRDRRTWAIAGAKALSDQVWWFLLFWAPDLFHRVFGIAAADLGAPVAMIYVGAATGSILGGVLSNRLSAAGFDLDRTRKTALLVCALAVTPVALVPQIGSYGLAVALLGLTLAAHQGFSVNLFALIADVVPAERVGTVTSIGALAGNLAGMTILAITGWVLSLGRTYTPLLFWAAVSYLLALAWIHLLLPRLQPAEAAA